MRIAIASLVFLSVGLQTATADVKGGKDHSLLPRYEGSEIIRYEHRAFDEYRLLTGPVKRHGGREKNEEATLLLEGAFTQIAYRAPAKRSSLEVFRNYEQAFKEAGFQTIYTCARENCGGRNFGLTVGSGPLYMLFGDQQAEQRFLSAKLSRPEGDVYASVYVILHRSGGGPNMDRALALLEIVEIKPMEKRMTVVEAPAMERDLAAAGRVAVYGILFDFDKDTMRADSKPQLDEIAKLLKNRSSLKVLIVGHTDARGGMDYNRTLSERRAQSIVAALARDYGIERSRLSPVGVGMAAPVSSNRNDQGRALNRRVELVDLGD